MKKLLIIIFVFTLFCAKVSADYNPSYRNVFWIHGVQGDVKSLHAFSDYFNEKYKINSYHPFYQSNRGFQYGAYQLSGLNVGNKSDDMVIAHSMGGLVARQFYKDYPQRRFGGLITISTPHLAVLSKGIGSV